MEKLTWARHDLPKGTQHVSQDRVLRKTETSYHTFWSHLQFILTFLHPCLHPSSLKHPLASAAAFSPPHCHNLCGSCITVPWGHGRSVPATPQGPMQGRGEAVYVLHVGVGGGGI